MKHRILFVVFACLIHYAEAKENRQSPPAYCPQPKQSNCCPQPKQPDCCPKPCAPCCPPVCFEKGYPTDPCCTPSAYSEPAAIRLDCGADLFVTASFIYWEAIQGGMELALPGQASSLNPLSGQRDSATGNAVLIQDFSYKPGFQVGLGWSGMKDHWILYTEYTRLHANTSTSARAPDPNEIIILGGTPQPFGVWQPTTWTGLFPQIASTDISSKWSYEIDFVDAQLSRPFYSGTRLILESLLGLRALWISQHLDLTIPVLPQTGLTPIGPFCEIHHHSHCWALGPRLGLNEKWHLGWGFSFIGHGSVSLLYTRYTKVTANIQNPVTAIAPIETNLEDFDCLRSNLDLSLGLSFGSYLMCRRLHWDLAASYDFRIFWEQNMMRSLADTITGTDGTPSSLYLQGLTIRSGFQF